MNKNITLLVILLSYSFVTVAQTDPKATEVWEPEPAVVTFDEMGRPSDAIILFDGKDLSAWEHPKKQGKPVEWIVGDGIFTVKPKTGQIRTKENFGSIQLHLEWSAPDDVTGDSQGRGNSGIYFCSKYEVQILDSYKNRSYSNGQAGSIYKQYAPLVNATKAPDKWQMYDIVFHIPEFDNDGNKTKSGSFTVFHNGVLIQDHVEIKGTTEYIGAPKTIAHGKGQILLQDHGNQVQYRNIWVRELD